MTLISIVVGAVLGVALVLVVLAGCGLFFVLNMDVPGGQDGRRGGCRRSSGKCGKCSRPAEPNREALARMYRAGWIDTDTVRGSKT